MSAKQWAGMMDGDESYAGARFYRFEAAVSLTGFINIIPTHQGRAKNTLYAHRRNGVDSNSTHLTTRANVEYSGTTAVDFPLPGLGTQAVLDFKGIDLVALERFILNRGGKYSPDDVDRHQQRRAAMISMENIRKTRELRILDPLFVDACRFAKTLFH